MSANAGKQETNVSRESREKLNGHKSLAIWLTGLPGSGKSTLARGLERELHKRGIRTYLLDDKKLYFGPKGDLEAASEEERTENMRWVAELSRLFVDAGVIVITPFITPLAKDREMARQIIGAADFLEVYAKCPLGVCQARDTRGIYREAKEGKIKNFPGVSSAYEAPEKPDITLDTWDNDAEQCIESILWGLFSKIKI
ncbi:MAG: adenylyl-sulfate kinase [Ignavibacteriales bacterium]